MSDIAEFEVLVDKELVAGTYGPRNEAMNEALHYYHQYKDGGVCELYEVKRILIPVIEVK